MFHSEYAARWVEGARQTGDRSYPIAVAMPARAAWFLADGGPGEHPWPAPGDVRPSLGRNRRQWLGFALSLGMSVLLAVSALLLAI